MIPNNELGDNPSYKEKYSSMKLQLKNILYENELYHDELIRLKRELIDIYSEKDTLIKKFVESGVDLGTSDDDDDSESQLSDILIPARCNENLATTTNCDATSKIITLSTPSIITTTTATTTPTTKATPALAICSASAATSATANNNSRAKPKPAVAAKSRAKSRPPAANKAQNSKAVQPNTISTINSSANGTNGKTNSFGPTKSVANKKKKQQQSQVEPQQQPLLDQKPTPVIEQLSSKPPPPKRQRKQPPKKPQTPKQVPEQHYQQQQQQQQPVTVIGQVQVSLPNDQIKFVQHVNLPEQNLAGNNNLIVANHNANNIHLHPNHDNSNQHHQIHFQLPQATISTMESFQTPQSIITTTQGSHLGYGQHQSYTIVATTNSNGNLIHHDLNQHHANSPPVQITQLVPMNQAVHHISNQTIQNTNIQNQTMSQELASIGFQQIQHHSDDQQAQQQRQDDTNYGHQIVHFELPQIQLPQQQTIIQHNHQLHLQAQQQGQQQQQQQLQPQSETIATDDLEQHLDSRRLEQAPLLMSDWESSVPNELFGSDSAIKFMAED